MHICNVRPILFGSKPTDGGHLILDREGRDKLTMVLVRPTCVDVLQSHHSMPARGLMAPRATHIALMRIIG